MADPDMIQFWLENVAVLPSRALSSGARPNRLSAKSLSLNTYTVSRRVVRGIVMVPVPVGRIIWLSATLKMRGGSLS